MNATQDINNIDHDDVNPTSLKNDKTEILTMVKNRKRKVTEVLPNFFQESDNNVVKLLVSFFNKIIINNIEKLNVLYLENFGFVIPMKKNHLKYYDDVDCFEMKKEDVLQISFEKCSVLSNYFKDKYKPIEFLDALKFSYCENDWKKEDISLSKMLEYAKAFVKFLKEQVIINGSSVLMDIGIFYSLHNRQGNDFFDWYAGADIIFVQRYFKTFFTEEICKYKKTIYKDSLDVFKATFGSPIGVIKVNLKKELLILGFDIKDVQSIKDPCFDVFVFKDDENIETGNTTLFYVTNFLRKYGIGTEFVLQLAVKEKFLSSSVEKNLPKYPLRAFAASWLTLQNPSLRGENTGISVKYNVPIFETSKNFLDGIFITDFEMLSNMQEAQDGKFYYKNILGVTKEEIDCAKKFSVKYVCDLLESKNLHQITRLERRSILDKTEHLAI